MSSSSISSANTLDVTAANTTASTTASTPANTTVMLLAAGRGKRMRHLTDDLPKPLLKVGSRTLIEHHLENLHSSGFNKIVINVAYCASSIKQHLGDGSRYGVSIRYSDESNSGALETAGGIKHALNLIDSDPFLVVNADIWTDYRFDDLIAPLNRSGRLVMVPNPTHNPGGDFSLEEQKKLLKIKTEGSANYTFSGIALYRKSLFSNVKSGSQALSPVFNQLIEKQDLEGIVYTGTWSDIGTPERLSEVNSQNSPAHDTEQTKSAS